MQPSQVWSWRSTGMIICARCLPRHGNSLPHVARLIDEYGIESLNDRILAEACEFGAQPSDLDFLLFRTIPDWRKVVESAVRGGHLHVLRWMRERHDDRGPWEGDFYDTMPEAARNGHLEIIKWLHERGLSPIDRSTLGEAIHHGHLPVVKWLLQEGVKLSRSLRDQLEDAAQNGRLVTVQRIHDNFKDADTSYAMAGAASNGNLDMLQWLHRQKRCSEACSGKVMDAAVGGGHLCVVEWLSDNCSKDCSNVAARDAGKAGNLPMLQWLHEHYSDRFDVRAMNSAASEGHLTIVKWLHEHRAEGCTSYAMDAAASNGHFEVVRWLHKHRTEGCTTGAMDGAAGNGYLDIVKWLHENRVEGCTIKAMRGAARKGHVDVLRWLVEHFPDKCRDDLMEIAAWEGHLDVVQYLHESTKQRASAWGLGATAKQGWVNTLEVLMQNFDYENGEVYCYRLEAVGKAFDKMLAQLSSRLTTPVTSLWREALEALERFHSCGFFSCVSEMLERALRRGYQPLVQQYMVRRVANEKRKYVQVAAIHWNLVLLRWMLEKGTPIAKSLVIELAVDPDAAEYVEVVSYLCEGKRVQLVREATANKWLKMLKWTLEKTSFADDSSRATISDAIKQAPSDTVQWLRDNMTDAEARKWYLPSHKRQRVE